MQKKRRLVRNPSFFPKIAFDGSPEYEKHVGGAGYRHGTRTPG